MEGTEKVAKKKASLEDFRIVDRFIDIVAPEYEAERIPAIRKARRAWGRILLTLGSEDCIKKCAIQWEKKKSRS